MKKIFPFLILMFMLMSCKKNRVDASSTQNFQSSINDMTSSLPTLKQTKFNEALYIIKTFAVEGDNDQKRIAALGKKLEGKNVAEIMALADQTADANGIAWTSTGPPSLGEMNIFGTSDAKEFDPNDIKAKSISIVLQPNSGDTSTATAVQIIPRLVDNSGQAISFEGAALPVTLEVFNNGTRLMTAKNLMQDNNFRGFALKYASITASKIPDGVIDITISIKTTGKNFKMSKIGVPVNINALSRPVITEQTDTIPERPVEPEAIPEATATSAGDPKAAVSRFLSNLNSNNLRAAYDASANPNWGSYENFSNTGSGFGGVKNISVKNISVKNVSDNTASVDATYDVYSQDGKKTALQVNFGMKLVNGDWKISSYTIK